MTTIHSHRNSQNELITISAGTMNGEPVELLVIHDDPPPGGTGIAAPMLFDESTRAWLLTVCGEREAEANDSDLGRMAP